MLELRISESGTTSSGSNITRYGLRIDLYRITSGSYDLVDYRLRGFFNHHYLTPIITVNGGYFIKDIQFFQGSGGTMTEGYDHWQNDIRPPRIDENKFAGEYTLYMPNVTLDAGTPSATQGRFNLRGEYFGSEKLGRYNDVQESYSYVGLSGAEKVSPMNWVFEKRDNTKTRTISNITTTGNTVTVTTSSAHPYSSGESVRITGVGSGSIYQFGDPGERYEGNFKITVTGANTFTYQTKHEVSASTHTSGTVEFWDVVVHERSISTIQGDGAGTITVDTVGNEHDLEVGDLIAIEGTTNYNGAQLEVTNVISTTSVECELTGNTSTASESTGTIKFSSRPPSGAIAVNYEAGYQPKTINDHTAFTYLRYSDKDTYIDNTVANDYGSSTTLNVRTFVSGGNYRRAVFRFPIAGIPLSQLLFAEVNAAYRGGSDSLGTQMGLYQMIDDAWNDSDTWTTINPKIDFGDPIGVYNFLNSTTGEQDSYTKFTMTTSKLEDWLTGVKSPTCALSKVGPDNSIVNEYSSTETAEAQPYIVVSSGVVADNTPPSVYLTNASSAIPASTSQGDGSGTITVTTSSNHYLSAGDGVNLLTENYTVHDTVVLGGVDAPTSTTFKVSIPGNTLTVIDSGGVILRHSVVNVSAVGIDDSEMSDDPSDIVVRKTAALTGITETNIVKGPITSVSFDFLLSGLDDGYFDVSVKDVIGNQSPTITPPVIMHYTNTLTGNVSEVVKAGDSIDIIGFNVDSPLTLSIGDDSLNGGVVPGGLTQSIGVGSIDGANNLFTASMPVGAQLEFNILSVDDTTDTILVENSNFEVGENIIFNAAGNNIVSPLKVGMLYFVVTANQIGSNTEIQVSTEFGGTPIDIAPPGTIDMVVYNYTAPSYVIKNGTNSSDYGNIVYIRLDDFPPKFQIDTILGTGSTINVVISDIYPVDQSSVSFVNGVQTATPIVDVNGDGRVLIYEVNITGNGTFRVDATDDVGNASFATQTIPNLVTPYIEVTGYTIVDADNFILNIRVVDDQISAIEAPDNSSPGVFVEGSVTNSSYGVISNLVAGVDEVTFDLTVTSRGDGVMTIYATTDDLDTASIQPPVLTSVSPECFSDDSIVAITGVNLDHGTYTARSFLSPLLTILSASMTTLNVYVGSGSPDGNFDFTLSVTQGGNTFISNDIDGLLDNSPPIITIIGDQNTEVIQGETYTELGVTATDNIFGDVTSSVVTQGSVDPNVLGTYYILYTATDPCGNESSVSRQVDVVTGCPVYIAVTPNEGFIGDTVTIVATVGLLNPVPTANVVTFNGIVATVIGGDRNSIQVIVPFGATSGPVQVETGPTNTGYENCSLSNIYQFTILFDDEEFDPERDRLIGEREKRKRIRTTSGLISPLDRGPDNPAIYNRDMSYSGFNEITDENSMVQNVFSIVLTRVGERIFNEEFGTRIEDYIHSIIDDVDEFEKKAITEIVEAVQKYEPRVIVDENESFVYYDENINDIKIVLFLRVPSGNVRTIAISLKHIRNGEPNI